MKLDLKDPNNFNISAVRALIQSKDDSRDRQLRVNRVGEAYISDIVGNQELDDVKFRFETWIAGNDYSGEKAAKDEDWVSRIFNALKKNWEEGYEGFVDLF